jgi:hypothetical protein
MARYKEYDYSQGKFIPIHFDKQILPGTFEEGKRGRFYFLRQEPGNN